MNYRPTTNARFCNLINKAAVVLRFSWFHN